MEEVMLHIKLDHSKLHRRIQWRIETTLSPGVCYHLRGPNGVGKTTLLEDLKLQWRDLCPQHRLGFVDQAPLAPFQELTVASVMDLLWDITPDRHEGSSWRELSWWQNATQKAWLPRKVSGLSGGENQWLKILMMRSLDCDVWVLDEPFQSLDSARQHELWQMLADWLKQNKYLVLVHHGELALSPVKDWELKR